MQPISVPVASVPCLTTRLSPVSRVLPPAPSMLWVSRVPYAFTVSNRMMPGAVPVFRVYKRER